MFPNLLQLFLFEWLLHLVLRRPILVLCALRAEFEVVVEAKVSFLILKIEIPVQNSNIFPSVGQNAISVAAAVEHLANFLHLSLLLLVYLFQL
jgi:hypothetical protein